jgi:hypothetical protein
MATRDRQLALGHHSGVPFAERARHPAETRRVARLIPMDRERACVKNHRPVRFANVRRFYRRGGS